MHVTLAAGAVYWLAYARPRQGVAAVDGPQAEPVAAPAELVGAD